MRKFLTGLALLASISTVQAQTPVRGQRGYDTGAVVNCIALDGSGSARCLMPGQIIYDQNGVPLGTAANPLVTSGGGDVTGTGSLALATINATYPILLSGGRNAVGLTINGLTGSGATITVERSNDGGTTWTPANTTESSATSSLSSTITANGQARVGVAGATNIRLRVSTAGTGTASVAYNATTAAGPVFLTSTLPQVNGSIGGVSGDVAAGVADTGNPVKMGCVGRAQAVVGQPSVAAGQRANCSATQYGQQNVTMLYDGFSASDGLALSQIGAAYTDTGNARILGAAPFVYNPTTNTLFMQRGDVTGTYIVSKGSATLATGQVNVGTTATLIRAADTGRTSIQIIVGAANACAFGNSGVTLTTGYLLPATAGATDTTATSAALYGVCSAATTVSYKAILP